MEDKIKIILKVIAIIASIYGLICTVKELLTLTYFTILSNVFIDVMLLITLINDIKVLKNKKSIMNDKLYITKFLATISISLTFFVFMFILAPTYPNGYVDAYIGKDCSSLCLHFITPLIAIIDFILFDKAYKHKNKHVLYSLIPPLVYLVFIYTLSIIGIRWGTMYAPYNFLNYHAPTSWFGFNPALRSWEILGIGVFYMIVILLIIFAIFAKILLMIKRKEN